VTLIVIDVTFSSPSLSWEPRCRVLWQRPCSGRDPMYWPCQGAQPGPSVRWTTRRNKAASDGDRHRHQLRAVHFMIAWIRRLWQGPCSGHEPLDCRGQGPQPGPSMRWTIRGSKAASDCDRHRWHRASSHPSHTVLVFRLLHWPCSGHGPLYWPCQTPQPGPL
jgi:hypothetical protein